MRQAGKKLAFPTYSPACWKPIRGPDLEDTIKRDILGECWERTADMEVPQFRDGECEIRQLWDLAVAEVMGWDQDWLTNLRRLLHQEPHVSGKGYGEFSQELEPD